MTITVGIIGDFDPAFPPHPATEDALGHVAEHLAVEIRPTWIPTEALEQAGATSLAAYDALWCAPGSPYRSMQGAIDGIRYAREHDRPLLGTCGGFQHIVLEYARHALGFVDADHAEYDPYASVLFVTPLSCSLAGQTMRVGIEPRSRAFDAYQRTVVEEHYYCNFGLNPRYQQTLHDGGLCVVGTDEQGEARIVELPDHRFFVGTLFVPQLRSTGTAPHPLIVAYVQAALECRSERE